MTPTFQSRFGLTGNCWPACLATIFDVPLAEVDHCACHHADWMEATDAWLEKRGLFYVECHANSTTRPADGALVVVGTDDPERHLRHVAIVRAKHVPGGWDCEIVHDPSHPDAHAVGFTARHFRKLILFCHIHR